MVYYLKGRKNVAINWEIKKWWGNITIYEGGWMFVNSK
jgi:hypothetical protein